MAVSERQDQQEQTSTFRILLYWPNIVDYMRLLLALATFFGWDQRTRPLLFASLYTVGFALDGVDGMLARRLNQVTHLVCKLSCLFPAYFVAKLGGGLRLWVEVRS